MALSLAAIGAGLGQGIEQIYRQKAQQAALDKLKQQSQAEALIGALPGSTYMPSASPFTPGIVPGGNPAPLNTTPPAGAGMAPQPVPPPAPPMTGAAPAIANDTGRGSGATGALPLDDTPEGQVAADVAGEQIGKGGPAAAPSAPAASAAPASTSPHSPEAHAAADAVGVSPDHPIQFSDRQYNQIAESLFRQPLTFGELVSRMQKARPDADPGTIGRAAIMTYKLIEQGDAAQNNMGFRVLSSLAALDRLKEQTRHNQASEGLGQQRADISAGRAATSASQGQQRIDIAKGNLEARKAAIKASMDRTIYVQGKIDARAAARETQQQAALAQRAGNQQAATKLRAITAQINAIHNKSPISGPSAEDQKKLLDLTDQAASVAAEVSQ